MNRTMQRKTICEELRKLKSHPTAEELYLIVRERMPQISLATVYRNLEQLSTHGVIRKLETAGKQKRFDGDISPHHHLRCRKCGRVADLFHEKLAGLDENLNLLLDELDCDFVALEFQGRCEDCRKIAE